MIELFSKDLSKLAIIKKNFLNKNDFHLSQINKINAKYIRLKKRIFCKNCKQKKLHLLKPLLFYLKTEVIYQLKALNKLL